MKCGLDNKVILTWTVAVFSKLFPIRLQHSTDQLSHTKWGWWFCSGRPGAINTGNIFLGHNRKAVIPTMRLTWTSALDIDPVSVPMATHTQKWISTRQWLTAEFCPPLPFPFPLPSSAFLTSVSGPANSLSFRRGRRGKKREFPQPRAKDQMGEGHNSSHMHFTPGVLRSWHHIGMHNDHLWQSLASQQ